LVRLKRATKQGPTHDGVTANVEGREAVVSVAIPGGIKRGEVTVRVRGGTEVYMALCDVRVDTGRKVVVIEDRGQRTLFVTPL
jgi:hypothetical protein